MPLFKKSKKQIAASNRRKRLQSAREEDEVNGVWKEGFAQFFIYFSFGILAVIFCFVGLSPAGPNVQENQISRIRISSEIDFDYVSRIQTEKKLAAQRQRVPPVYRLAFRPYERFREYLLSLYPAFAESAPSGDGEELRVETASRFLQQYSAGNPYGIRPSDLSVLYNQLGKEKGIRMLNEGLHLLRDIHRQGIFDPEDGIAGPGESRLSFFNIEDEQGNITEVEILSETEALRNLRIHLAALDAPRESSIAIFRILRNGLEPNLKFDEQRTNELIAEALAQVEPVKIEVSAGETIIEPNVKVTALQFEQLEAYRKALKDSRNREFGVDLLLMERTFLAFMIILSAAFYLKTSRMRARTNQRLFLLSGVVILLNLGLNRLILEIGDSAVVDQYPIIGLLLPFFLPVALGPIILTILVGVGPAVLATGLIGMFTAMMQGNSLVTLLFTALSGFIGIYYCRNIQVRASLVRAGFVSGTALGLGAIFIGIRDGLPPFTVIYQVMSGMGTGLMTGIVVVGLLPILEQIFKYTTDITLLELTDYNHPLLRKLQVEAPGSYHHSLMVANLSENAAAKIGANPLVCRVCSLFHDIGKMIKPDYYAENQRDGQNPHIERNPSVSALVIKSHVKEGVQLARKAKLPRIIIDVIQQHHGTSLIGYFYYKALEQQRASAAPDPLVPNAPRIELDKVNEATYRYEGPVPQFTESAIIMLADSVEAASRSLRKVTPQSVEELVDNIFTARMEDGQLDATPLTFHQLKTIRETFQFTLLNMLHARVEYPDEARESEKRARKKQAKKSRPTPNIFPPMEGDTEGSSGMVDTETTKE